MNIYCPHCGQGYDVAEKHLNKTLLCETCHKEFLIKFDPTKKRCPACGEEILTVAKKCRFCGENLEPREEEPDHWPAWKIVVAIIAVVLIISGGVILFGNEVGIDSYLLMIVSIVGILLGISIPVFIISKICEIARNTRN